MFYLLAHWLQQFNPHFSLFFYITLRAILACLTSLVGSILLAPKMIRFLKVLSFGQVIRELGPESHQSKAGTPTMGGILIVSAIVISSIL